MIAWASMYRFLAQDHDDIVVDIRPEWSIEDLLKGDMGVS
jgi:hypothetical protein